MNRLNRILTLVLVAQIGVAVLVFLPRIFPAGAESAPLFGVLEAKDITGLAVQDKDGNRVELVKQGDAWSVPSSENYPADAEKINTFLTKILNVKTDPLVTRTSASHKRLQVADDDFVRRVDLTLADGGQRTLFLGTTGNGGSLHVRAGGQDEVYLARDLYSYDASTEVAGWINPVYFSVAQDKMTGLTLQNANGTFEFTKDVSGTWAMKGLAAGEEFNANNLTTLLTRLSSLNMTRPLGKQAKPEYGLDKPSAVITVMAKDDADGDKTYTLRIGAKETPAVSNGQAAQNSAYVAISSESSYYAQIADYGVEDFVTRTRNDFLNLPPTPMATPGLAPTESALTPVGPVTPTLETTPTLTATPIPAP